MNVAHPRHHRPRIARERRAAAQHLVEHGTQTVLIAVRAHFRLLTPRLLRGHVRWSSKNLTLQRHVRRFVGHAPRQTEIHDLRATRSVHHDVRRLDVAVNDPFPVGVVQGVRDLTRPLHGRSQGQWSVAEQIRKRDAVHELRSDERNFAGLPTLVNCDDVGVPQSRRGFGLANEPRLHGRTVRDEARNLEGNLAIEQRIEGPIDRTERSVPQRRFDPESANAFPSGSLFRIPSRAQVDGAVIGNRVVSGMARIERHLGLFGSMRVEWHGVGIDRRLIEAESRGCIAERKGMEIDDRVAPRATQELRPGHLLGWKERAADGTIRWPGGCHTGRRKAGIFERTAIECARLQSHRQWVVVFRRASRTPQMDARSADYGGGGEGGSGTGGGTGGIGGAGGIGGGFTKIMGCSRGGKQSTRTQK